MKKLLILLFSLIALRGFSTTHIVGSGSGSVSVTSMTGYALGDTILIPSGNYTLLQIQNMDSVHVLPQNSGNIPVFSQTSNVWGNRWCEIANLKFVWGSGSGIGWQMNGAKSAHNNYHDLSFYGFSSSVFTMHNGLAYTWGDHTTSISDQDTWHDIVIDSCGQLFQGSFWNSSSNINAPTDFITGATFYNIQDIATSLCCGNGEGTGIRGDFFELTVHDCKITDRSGRGADGDVGWIYLTCGSVHAWNIVKWGGPGAIVRNNNPMNEVGHPWKNEIRNCGKFEGTQYGGITINAVLTDTIAGTTFLPDNYYENITMGNQINDTLGYESSVILCGQGRHNYCRNIFGFNVGNNTQRVAAGGHPNNNNPQLIQTLCGGCWVNLATDTTHNQYYNYATVAGIDTTTIAYTNRIGSWKGYFLKTTSAATLVATGTSTLIGSTAFPDIYGLLMHSPPDLGYAQLQPSSTTLLSYTRLSTDYIRPGGSFQHWGTSDWGAFNATPTIPPGNTVPLDYYMRLNWTDIESTTTQGSYSWTIFDQQFNAAMANNAMVHVAVMDMCSACGLPAYGYPTYLHNLMQGEAANSRDWQDADGVWVPNWNSPNYIARYTALMNAIAAHINSTSHSGIPFSKAFVNWDIRSYGDFGEGHTYPWTGTEPTGRTATSASLEALYDAAATAFPGVYITFPFAYQDHGHNSDIPLDAGYYILTKQNAWGLWGLRRDNWGDDGYTTWITGSPDSYNPGTGSVSFATLMVNRWKFAPWTGEPANDLNGTSRCGSIQCDLINEINTLHAQSIGNGNYPIATNDPTNGAALVSAIQNANKVIGNKLVIDATNTTTSPSTGGAFNISTSWKNLNVAPIYEKRWKVIYELRRTSDQAVMWRDTSKFKPFLFLPQATDSVFADNFLLTGVSASTCDLHVTIKDSFGYLAPYPLANTGKQGDGSYILRSGIAITTSGVPTANAGSDQTISLPTSSVTLNGSLSSGALTSFLWTQILGPSTATLTSPASITTSATGLIQGTYIFQLAVNGGSSGSFIDQATVIVNAAAPPIANAGTSQTISPPTSSVTLDGSASTGNITSYAWTNVSGPATPTIVSGSNATTLVTGLSATGSYIFQLSLNGGASTANVTVNLNPPPSNGVNIFTTQVPLANGGPDAPVELGMKFKSSVNGFITGIRFYKTSAYTGTHTGELYSAAGVRLAQATFTAESATGWQTVSFASPVPIVAGLTYVAAYYNASGSYTDDNTGSGGTTFATAINNSPLTGLADGQSGANGLYSYSASPVFPTSTYKSSNYWVDVVFSTITTNILKHHLSTLTLWKKAP